MRKWILRLADASLALHASLTTGEGVGVLVVVAQDARGQTRRYVPIIASNCCCSDKTTNTGVEC